MQPQISGFGLVRGPGTGTSDSIPTALSDGEVVIPADKVRNFGAAQIMALVDKGGSGVKKPPVKEGRLHAATGGLVDASTPGLGAVSRVGNSYSGGNVSGPVSINGQAPGGTFSSTGLGAVPKPAVPAAPQPSAAPAGAQPATFNPALGVGRPNALGSLADTNAQIASLQATNGTAGLGVRPAVAAPTALGAQRPISSAATATVQPAQQPQFFVGGGVQPPAAPVPAAAVPPAAAPAPIAAPAPAATVPYTNRVGGVGPQLAAYRDGGLVDGPGTSTSDSIPALLSKDEVVMPADTVRAVGADNLLAVIDATHTPTGFGARRKGRPAFADGGIVTEEEIKRQQGGGAAFGIYPRPSSQLSTNANDAALQRGVVATGPQSFEPAPAAQVPPAAAASPASAGAGRGSVNPPVAQPAAAPEVVSLTVAPAANSTAPAPAPAAAPATTLPAGVTRDGNSFAGSNVAAPPGPAAPRADALGSLADTQAQLANLQASNAAVPTGGATIIDNAGAEAERRAQFNESANSGNALARTSWSPRRGVQGDDAAVAAALTPLQLRMRAAADARRSGDETQRALIAERGAEARTKLQERQQGQANGIAQQRLALEAARLANDGVPSGYRRDASGNLTFIPGGPADPSTPKGKNSLNDTQAKALQFGSRMQASEEVLGKMATQGVNQPGLLKRGADALGVGALANWTQSAEQQQVEQAQRDFINAALRRESGAAIADSEFANARTQYFPQPGDSAEVIAQKKQNRDLATRGILAEVPDAERRITQVRDVPAGAPAAQATAPGAAPAAALPQGMSRQIGTSGGKPVYEDAQGRRFVAG